jgi:predicted nucleotidyltransferase component of viral defense system
LWTKQYYRPTKDIDFLSNTSNQPDVLHRIFKEICEVEVEHDGLIYDSGNISIEETIEGNTYHGLRIKLLAFLQNIRIPLQFDIGFGDAVYPSIEEINYPTLLDFPKPTIQVYPLESLISEKVEAMVDLGMQNTRMKDFYDVYSLSRIFDIDGLVLQKAIHATFTRRMTEIPQSPPLALTDEFAFDNDKIKQWQLFTRKNNLTNAPVSLSTVIDELKDFLLPVFTAINENVDFTYIWNSHKHKYESKST